jgi:uncharacterized protein YwgA
VNNKSFFGLKDDIYICFIYNPPEYSSYSRKLQDDILELIEKDIFEYSNDGKIILATLKNKIFLIKLSDDMK